jgi:hypothetical protein
MNDIQFIGICIPNKSDYFNQEEARDEVNHSFKKKFLSQSLQETNYPRSLQELKPKEKTLLKIIVGRC